MRRGRRIEDQRHRREEEQAARRGHQRTIGEPGDEQIAQRHADAEHAQHHRHEGGRDMRHRHQGGGKIGIDREEPAEADRADPERQPDLAAPERTELAQRAGTGRRLVARRVYGDQRHRDEREHRDDRETRSPSDRLPDPARHRHADHGGDGEAEHHAADRGRAFVGRHQRRRDQRRQPEIGTVRQARQEAEGKHPMIGRRDRRQRIADREQPHQCEQLRPPRDLRTDHRHQRRTDNHAQGISRDDMAGGRLVDAEPLGEIGQQAHRREFGGADRETAHRQREHHEPGMMRRAHRRDDVGHGGLSAVAAAQHV